jgi:hypothetical protein
MFFFAFSMAAFNTNELMLDIPIIGKEVAMFVSLIKVFIVKNWSLT